MHSCATGYCHQLARAGGEGYDNLQPQLARPDLLVVDELGSILVTNNLPFDEWTEVFGSERLTGALLDRLTHHVHILEMNGESYRLKHSRENPSSQAPVHPEEE